MNINLGSVITQNTKTGRKKFGIGSLIFMILGGVIFIVVGFSAMNSSKVDPSWKQTTGEIVDVTSRLSSDNDGSRIHRAIIRYEVNGKTYKVTGHKSSSTYPKIGNTLELTYNPSQPSQYKLVSDSSQEWMKYLPFAVGALLLVTGPFLYIRSKKRNDEINRLMQSGQKLQGVMVDVQRFGGGVNRSGDSFNRSSRSNESYKIVVSAADASGAVQNYVSDSLVGAGIIATADFRSTPIPIDVYVDPVNPKNYYVDVSDIPNLTPERIKDLIESVRPKQPATFTEENKSSDTSINPTPPSLG